VIELLIFVNGYTSDILPELLSIKENIMLIILEIMGMAFF